MDIFFDAGGLISRVSATFFGVFPPVFFGVFVLLGVFLCFFDGAFVLLGRVFGFRALARKKGGIFFPAGE